jgi:uncharacterized protein YdaT
MPWTSKHYPDSLKNFSDEVREKAIEIANALLEQGYDEGKAIAIATDKAKEWAENRDIELHEAETQPSRKKH